MKRGDRRADLAKPRRVGRRMAPLFGGLVVAFVAALPPVSRAQQLAWDEFDGKSRGGWKQAGLGEWANAGAIEEEGVLRLANGNDHRELATPIDGGVVWYAVTLRMAAKPEGYATVAPSDTANGQFSELGFNSAYGSTEGLWTSSLGIVKDGVEATERQTFAMRYDFDRHVWSAWAAQGDGRSLLDADGLVSAEPKVREATLTPKSIGWLYVSKGCPQKLEIERVALARTACEALSLAGERGKVAAPTAAPVPAASSAPGVLALTDASSPLRDGDVVDFFGDSLTWQGGFVELLAKALRERQPARKAEFLRRGINGGKSTDLRDGCKELYGCTQKPLAQVVQDDHATAAVIMIGINDVWHGEKGNAPSVYRAALKDLVKAAKAAGCVVVVATPTVIGEKARGQNEFDAKLDEYAKIALQVAKEAGVAGVDLRKTFFAALATRNPDGKRDGVLTYDGVHLLDAGNELVAGEFGSVLAAAIASARRPARSGQKDASKKSEGTLKPDSELSLIPWPKSVTKATGELTLTGRVIATTTALEPVAAVLAETLSKLGMESAAASIGSTSAAGVAHAGDIVLELDATLAGEAYRFDSGRVDRPVAIAAASPLAVAQAGATLLQLARVGKTGVAVPRLVIRDEPDCGYRGLLLDVARQPHSIATIEQAIELCRFYKLNFLQLHLADDQSFTFPSTAFPTVATSGRSYTLAELRGLEAFSQARGVTIVPELDMPGHCGALIAARPDLFRASEKHHATIDFAKPECVAAMATLVGELLAVFRASPWFHLGGDECDLEHVAENPDFPAAFAREKVADAQQLYCWFLGHMNDVVKKLGRKTLVWEGFGHGATPAIPRDVTVMVYESLYHLPDCLLRDGYPVINTSWEPLYVVNDRKWSVAEIHGWNRYYWKHFIEGYPAAKGLRVEPTAQVLGGQMCAWEQADSKELPSLRCRAAAMSERLWNPGAARGFEDFSARLDAVDACFTTISGAAPAEE